MSDDLIVPRWAADKLLRINRRARRAEGLTTDDCEILMTLLLDAVTGRDASSEMLAKDWNTSRATAARWVKKWRPELNRILSLRETEMRRKRDGNETDNVDSDPVSPNRETEMRRKRDGNETKHPPLNGPPNGFSPHPSSFTPPYIPPRECVLIAPAREAVPFGDFWDAYGKKVGRKKCEAKWARIPEGVRQQILEHVRVYVSHTPEVMYRKDPATYLNGEHWNDEHPYRQSRHEPDAGPEGGAGITLATDDRENSSAVVAHTTFGHGQRNGAGAGAERRTSSDRRSGYGLAAASRDVDRALDELKRGEGPA